MKKTTTITFKVLLLSILLASWCFAVFDRTKPTSSTSLRSSNPEILDNWIGIEAAIDNEHDFLTGGSQTGVHTIGSARAFFQTSAPTTRVNGDAWTGNDIGSLWFDSDSTPDNQFNVLTNDAGSGTWTPISDEVIAVMVAATHTWVASQTLGAGADLLLSTTSDITISGNTFTVAGATGDTVIAGTLGVTGVATLGDGSVAITQSVDDNSTQLATTAYADAQVAASYTPTTQAGANESNGEITLPNGLQLKWGHKTVNSDADLTITFGNETDVTAFSNICFSGWGNGDDTDKSAQAVMFGEFTATTMRITNAHAQQVVHWFAIGR